MKKADYIHRAIAKAVDFLIVGLLSAGGPVGVVAAGLYMTISDGFFHGASIGKRLIGLRVVARDAQGDPRGCGFRESMIRNVMFGVIVVFAQIPVLGWFIFLPLGFILILVETYFVYMDDLGIRIGDIFAGSQVIDVPPAKKS